MGRPKKYTEDIIIQEAASILKYAKDTAIPFEKEFASRRGYSSQRISEFAKESEVFAEALKRMKDIQEVKIAKAALVGKINPTMAIFTLKNVAGWRDKPIENIPNEALPTLCDIIKEVTMKSKKISNQKNT